MKKHSWMALKSGGFLKLRHPLPRAGLRNTASCRNSKSCDVPFTAGSVYWAGSGAIWPGFLGMWSACLPQILHIDITHRKLLWLCTDCTHEWPVTSAAKRWSSGGRIPATKSVTELNQALLPVLALLTLPLLSDAPDHSELGSSQENAVVTTIHPEHG